MVLKSFRPLLLCALGVCVGLLANVRATAAPETARATIVRAILTTDDAQKHAIINSLIGQGDEAIREIFTAWRQDNLYIYTAPTGAKVPVELTGDKAHPFWVRYAE